MASDPEVDLVEGLLARDEGALRRVMAIHAGAVYGMARRVLGESTMAEEVAQDTFLALWRRPGAYDPERGPLKAFLLGVARNKAIDAVRKEQGVRRTKEELVAGFESELAVGVADSTFQRAAEATEVRKSLGMISAVQREAIVLAYFGGRTYREVAEELGIPEGTAKTRLRDGLKRLKEVLDTDGRR